MATALLGNVSGPQPVSWILFVFLIEILVVPSNSRTHVQQRKLVTDRLDDVPAVGVERAFDDENELGKQCEGETSAEQGGSTIRLLEEHFFVVVVLDQLFVELIDLLLYCCVGALINVSGRLDSIESLDLGHDF